MYKHMVWIYDFCTNGGFNSIRSSIPTIPTMAKMFQLSYLIITFPIL